MNILQSSSRQLYFIRDFITAIRGRIRATQTQKYVFRSNLLTIESVKDRLFTWVMLNHWQVSHLFLTPNLMLRVDLRFSYFLLLLFLHLRLVFLTNFCLYLSIRLCDLFFLAFFSDGSRIEHTTFIWVLNDIRILLSSYHLLQSHH